MVDWITEGASHNFLEKVGVLLFQSILLQTAQTDVVHLHHIRVILGSCLFLLLKKCQVRLTLFVSKFSNKKPLCQSNILQNKSSLFDSRKRTKVTISFLTKKRKHTSLVWTEICVCFMINILRTVSHLCVNNVLYCVRHFCGVLWGINLLLVEGWSYYFRVVECFR